MSHFTKSADMRKIVGHSATGRPFTTREERVMRHIIQRCLMATVLLASMCGFVAAEEAGKDWYIAFRTGYQPYHLTEKGTARGRDFNESASLKDIIDKTDTTILGGELEYGKGKWFLNFAGFYQKSEASKGNSILGTDVTFKETGLNPMVGYRVYETSLGGDRHLLVDAMAGIFYIKIEGDMDFFAPDPVGNHFVSRNLHFVDPMVGLRTYLALTKKFGIAASGQIGGFGVGSDLQTVLSGSLVYNFTNWLAVSVGYKYWYFKYADSSAPVSHLEQTLQGPTLGLQFKY
jgi:hypothetical protein